MCTSTRVTLELNRSEEPISGSFSVAGGAPVKFSGWLELVALLEGALGAAASRPDERDGPSP